MILRPRNKKRRYRVLMRLADITFHNILCFFGGAFLSKMDIRARDLYYNGLTVSAPR